MGGAARQRARRCTPVALRTLADSWATGVS